MAQRVHRKDVRRFLVGLTILTIIGAVAAIGISMQTGGGLPGKTYTYVTAEFDNVGWLSTQAEVAENGVRVGQVESITNRGPIAVVTMRLDGDRQLYQDATAAISNTSALGKRRILLDFGTPAAGSLAGQPIPASRTHGSLSLDDIYSGLDEQTRYALASSLRELGTGLAGRGEDLQAFLRTSAGSLDDLRDISSTLADPATDLPSLLASANRLTGRFAMRQEQLTTLLQQTDDTFRAVNVDDAKPLDDTLRALPATLRQARQGLDALNKPLDDVRSAMTTLRPGGQALGASANDLRGVLREAPGPLTKVPGVSETAGPAVEDLTRTVGDARPLLPRVSEALGAAGVLLGDLAPYAPDIGRWASEYGVVAGQVEPDQHYLSLTPVLPALGLLDLPDPMADRSPYPAPGGTAWDDNRGSGGGR